MLKGYQTQQPVWGYAASLLLEDDLVYSLVGGEGSAVVAYVVTQDRQTAGPFAFAPCRCHLVARPLSNELSLELGEGQEHV